LFVVQNAAGGWSVLLAQRNAGEWSIPGGRSKASDGDHWATAKRETVEEFGSFPTGSDSMFSFRYPFRAVGFDWTTFVVKLAGVPAGYPDRHARDFRAEFRDAAWFPASNLPPKSHWLLYPVLRKLRKMPS
jgi:8-oxo-dGTP pyrophosphatase MutT (NUDIX family)